jgi:hypothetical protein
MSFLDFKKRPNLKLGIIFRKQVVDAAVQRYVEKNRKGAIRLAAMGDEATGRCNIDPKLFQKINPPIPTEDLYDAGADKKFKVEIAQEVRRTSDLYFIWAKKEGSVIKSKKILVFNEEQASLDDGFESEFNEFYESLMTAISNGKTTSKERCESLRDQITQYFKDNEKCDQSDGNEKIISLGPIKHIFDTLKRGPTLAKMCANCHSDKSTEAPLIPFGDEAELKKWLKQDSKRIKSVLTRINPATKEGRMPPTRPVEGEDGVALKAYFEMLSNEK